MEENTKQKIKKFMSEIQVLKRLDHIGVRLAGVKSPDSVADHVMVSAQITYVLARLEGADAAKSVLMNLFHDNTDVRIGDQHRVSKRYIDGKQPVLEAETEHFTNLPDSMAQEIIGLQQEKRQGETKEAIIAREADYLELAIQAKIYEETGYKGCKYWIDNIEKVLKTNSAKEILDEIRKDPDFLNCWWVDIEGVIIKD